MATRARGFSMQDDPTHGSDLRSRQKKRAERVTSPVHPYEVFRPKEMFDLVDSYVAEQGAVLFGTTRDGGVLTVICYLDGKGEPEYIHNRQEWLRLLEELIGVIPDPPALGGTEGTGT